MFVKEYQIIHAVLYINTRLYLYLNSLERNMIILDHKKIVNAIEKEKAVQCHSKFDILTLSIVLEANFWKQLDLDCLQTGLDLPPQAQDDDPKYSR